MYYDNKSRSRIYGQPADVPQILSYLYPDKFILQNNEDDLYKKSIPDYTISDWYNFFKLEWQEFHTYIDESNNEYIFVKLPKWKYCIDNNSPIINFNRSSGIAYFIKPADIANINEIVDLYNYIPTFKHYNEHKSAYMIPVKNLMMYIIPIELYKKKWDINIIPCPSQQLNK